jgi:hypothetical protein
MPKKTQQKRRHIAKKQKRTLKRNVKRTMRGGAVVYFRQKSSYGLTNVYSDNVNSEDNWVIEMKNRNIYMGYDMENGFKVHIIQQPEG